MILQKFILTLINVVGGSSTAAGESSSAEYHVLHVNHQIDCCLTRSVLYIGVVVNMPRTTLTLMLKLAQEVPQLLQLRLLLLLVVPRLLPLPLLLVVAL